MPPPLAEWEQRELHGLRLTGSDRELLESLANGKRLSFSEHGDGVTISARGWIGVVRLQACTIRVVPRLIDGHRSLVKMLAFLGHFSLLKQLDRDAPFLENDCDLFDLIALLLARECNRVAQRGPLADYEYQRDELALLRGRLDAKAQAIRKFGRVDTLVCEFDERVTDVPENRWLLRALRVARRRVEQQAVRDHVGRALGTWEEVCTDDSSEALPKPEFSRANAHYRSALSLAYLILDGTTASDLLTSGKVGGFSFMLSMPRLFEDFVAR